MFDSHAGFENSSLLRLGRGIHGSEVNDDHAEHEGGYSHQQFRIAPTQHSSPDITFPDATDAQFASPVTTGHARQGQIGFGSWLLPSNSFRKPALSNSGNTLAAPTTSAANKPEARSQERSFPTKRKVFPFTRSSLVM